jgi:DMSO reductase anchor subunit
VFLFAWGRPLLVLHALSALVLGGASVHQAVVALRLLRRKPSARLLRWAAIVCGFVLPLLLCYFSKWFWTASVICLIGLLVERWLFFAEAEHVVRLYHGQQRV